jgi:hypothetical protein
MKKMFLSMMLALGACVMLSSCGCKKESAIKGYEWLKGKWVSEDASNGEEFYHCILIGDNYYQETSYNWDGEVITEPSNQPKNPINITIEYNEFLNTDVKTIGSFYLDEEKHKLYWLYDFDIPMYMIKVE